MRVFVDYYRESRAECEKGGQRLRKGEAISIKSGTSIEEYSWNYDGSMSVEVRSCKRRRKRRERERRKSFLEMRREARDKEEQQGGSLDSATANCRQAAGQGTLAQVTSVRHGERSVLPGPSGRDVEPPRRLLFLLSNRSFPRGPSKMEQAEETDKGDGAETGKTQTKRDETRQGEGPCLRPEALIMCSSTNLSLSRCFIYLT